MFSIWTNGIEDCLKRTPGGAARLTSLERSMSALMLHIYTRINCFVKHTCKEQPHPSVPAKDPQLQDAPLGHLRSMTLLHWRLAECISTIVYSAYLCQGRIPTP